MTQRVDSLIEALFRTLFQRYGFVTQHQLSDFKSNVRQYTYNVQDPLSLVFDLVEDLQLLADAAGTLYSELQLVSFGVEILRNTHDFQDGIKTWNRLPVENKNWATFITHFEAEYQELLELRGPSMNTSSLHSANAIVKKVTASVEQSMTASVAEALNCHGAHSMLTETPSAQSNIPPALQNLPPGYSIQEVPVTSGPPSVAFSSFSSGTSNNSNNMEMMMKLFIEKWMSK